MFNSSVKVSVAMCTFNGSKYLRQQLDSILSQTIPINEIVVCDDISTDKTFKILNTYAKKWPGLFRLFRNKNRMGVKQNFEQAISLTTGDIIFLSDQDDIWISNKVEKFLKIFETNQQISAIYTDAILINQYGKPLNNSLWEKLGFDATMQTVWKNNEKAFEYLKANYNRVTGATMAFRKSLINEFLPFNMASSLWHDGQISLHASRINGLYLLDEKLIKYRIHNRQQIGIGNGVIYKSDKPKQHFIKRITNRIRRVLKYKLDIRNLNNP